MYIGKCAQIAKFNVHGFKMEKIPKRVNWPEIGDRAWGAIAQNDQENGVSFTLDNDGVYKSKIIPDLDEWKIEFYLKVNFVE